METLKKQTRPLDLAIACGRKRQSPQTGMVHYFHKTPFSHADAIPVFENLCFILALFRTREADPIQEAKDLLVRILSYQTESGGFPRYLHEYPNSSNPKKNLKLLLPLRWIEREFHSILEPSLKNQIKDTIIKLNAFLFTEDTFSGLDELAFKTMNAASMDIPSWERRLFDLKANTLGKLLIYRPEFRNKVEGLYSPDLKTYIGPYASQNGTAPELSLLDLIFMDEEISFLKRYPEEHALFLQGALVPHFPLHSNEGKDLIIARDPYFRMIWGKSDQVHSIACDQDHDLFHQKKEIHLHYHLKEEENEEAFELSFYLSRMEESQVWIEKDKATTFQLGDVLTLVSGGKSFEMQFLLLEGKGEFLGHISFANRPNQVRRSIFEAHDWRIGLRTVRRKEPCKLLVKIRLAS